MIEAGDTAPAFSLKDQDGKTHRLSDYKGKWVVLYFYPKDNTPGCTKQACGFRDRLQEFADRGAVVLGVSPDNEASHRKFADDFDLPFPLLADPDRNVAERYGVWREKKNYGRTYMGIVRTTYVIDPSGKVARCFNNVKVAGHDEKVLAAIG